MNTDKEINSTENSTSEIKSKKKSTKTTDKTKVTISENKKSDNVKETLMDGVIVSDIKNESFDLHLKVTVTNQQIESLIDNKIAEILPSVRVQGFRVGKVPASAVRRKFYSSLRAEIVQKQVSEITNEIIKKRDLNLLFDPNIGDLKNERDSDLEFTIKFALSPEFKLPEFSKIKLEKPELLLDEKLVEKQLKTLQESNAEFDKKSKAAAKNGDKVVMDAIGYADGKAFDGGKLENYEIILGSKSLIDGYEDQLVGKKAGEEVEVNVTFPENYHSKDLSGKDAKFDVKIISVYKPKLPELNEEFAEKFKCKNIEELKEKISNNIRDSYKKPIHGHMKKVLFDDLENKLDFEVPASLLENELGGIKNAMDNQENSDEVESDSSKDKKSKKDKSDKDDTEYKNIAMRRVRIGLMLSRYAKIHNIDLSEQDLKDAISEQMKMFPGQEKLLIEYYTKNKGALESLKANAIEDKTVDKILTQVQIETKQLSEDKLKEKLGIE